MLQSRLLFLNSDFWFLHVLGLCLFQCSTVFFQIIVVDWLWAFPACMLWARVAVVGHVFHPIGGQHFADLASIFELLSC